MKPVEISASAAKSLRQLEKKKAAIGQMIRMMTEQGEKQIIDYNDQTSRVWQSIRSETGIDIDNVLWVPHATENKVVPVQMKFNIDPLPTGPSEVG